jgi:hypothetical protein
MISVTGKELSAMFSDSKNPFTFITTKNPHSETKLQSMAEALEIHFKGFYETLGREIEQLKPEFFETIRNAVKEKSSVPCNFYTQWELGGMEMDRFGCLEKPTEWTAKLVIAAVFIRGFFLGVICNKKFIKDTERMRNIGSVLYLAFQDLLKSSTPIYPRNQKDVINELKVKARDPLKISSLSSLFDIEDERDEIVVGFFNKLEMVPLKKIRKSLFETAKDGMSKWLDKVYRMLDLKESKL